MFLSLAVRGPIATRRDSEPHTLGVWITLPAERSTWGRAKGKALQQTGHSVPRDEPAEAYPQTYKNTWLLHWGTQKFGAQIFRCPMQLHISHGPRDSPDYGPQSWEKTVPHNWCITGGRGARTSGGRMLRGTGGVGWGLSGKAQCGFEASGVGGAHEGEWAE